MEIRGIKPVKVDGSRNLELFELRPAEYLSVPLVADDGDTATRAVNVGEKVKEGSLIAKPKGKYGAYVYSPVCGKVVSVVKKLNASGNLCEHVVIARDLSDEKEYLRPMDDADINQETLLKRLYESGMIDNFEPYDPSYKKYLLKNPIKELVINCAPFDPYALSADALLTNFLHEVFEGARLLQQVAGAEKLVFLFTVKQKRFSKIVSSFVSSAALNKVVKVKFYPNIYPLQFDRLVAYYETGKMVPEGTRTAEIGVIVDSVNNCYDFYNVVRQGKPAIERAVTISGNNCVRKANYFVKNGTPISHILDIVGTVENVSEKMLVYGGIMTGLAQESAEVSVTLTASTILLCDAEEFIVESYMPCINCGKCNDVCPVKLNVRKLDQCFMDQKYTDAKSMHVSSCIGCGCCSYVCPSRRNLSQRMRYMKDYAMGKRAKSPDSSEYVLVEGEDLRNSESLEKVIDDHTSFEKVSDRKETPAIEEMLNVLDQKSKTGGKKDE